MKKLLLSFCLFSFSLVIISKPVSPEKAIRAAETQVSQNNKLASQNLKLIYTYTYTLNGDRNSAFYVYGANDNSGWVIISADDAAHPLLAYSTEGDFIITDFAPHFAKWMNGYTQEIRYIAENKLEADASIRQEWDNFLNGTLPQTLGAASVNPLIMTKWNQNPYENALCPYDYSASQRTVTGCTATAMAQIMKYHNYPAQGTGYHSYSHSKYGTLSANFGTTTYAWGSMPNNSTTSSAMATLMYHCGVSVEMNYGIAANGGSGAYVISSQSPITHCAEYAFKTYFNYATTIQGIERVNYTFTNWVAKLKAELDASRPLQYAGFGQGGHTWVCDGYDANDYFHMNWGWAGVYDGYFSLNSLNPGSGQSGGGNGTYNSGQQALIGIKPGTGGGSSGTTYDMRLYAAITSTPATVTIGSSFTIKCDVLNASTTQSFSGDFACGIFTMQDSLVGAQYLYTYTLPVNNHYTNGITFSFPGITNLLPGSYKACIFYKPTSASGFALLGDGNYQNCKLITFQTSSQVNASLILYSVINVPATVTPSQSFVANFDVLNQSGSSFNGDISLDLHSLSGAYISNLGTYTTPTALPNNYHYTGGLTFNVTPLNQAPGDYLVVCWYKPSGGSWYVTGSGAYVNPITLRIVSPGMTPDMYEANNNETVAYKFTPNFISNVYKIKTTGTNLHNGTDLDYFKCYLPSGYNYTITGISHDKYRSTDGNTYSVDVSWQYRVEMNSWSEAIDDELPSAIQINNGGNIMLAVSPYFTGETGTYLLDLQITRVPNGAGVNINETSGEALKLYPNPSRDFLNVNLDENLISADGVIKIFTLNGQLLRTIDHPTMLNTIDVSGLGSGMYILQYQDKMAVLNKRFVVSR